MSSKGPHQGKPTPHAAFECRTGPPPSQEAVAAPEGRGFRKMKTHQGKNRRILGKIKKDQILKKKNRKN
jgi:hypothetical protein